MTSPRLDASTLSRVPPDVARPPFDRTRTGIGIVHLGLGAFHRAHQAIYTDDAIAAVPGDWAIAGVSLRSADVSDRWRTDDWRRKVRSNRLLIVDTPRTGVL